MEHLLKILEGLQQQLCSTISQTLVFTADSLAKVNAEAIVDDYNWLTLRPCRFDNFLSNLGRRRESRGWAMNT